MILFTMDHACTFHSRCLPQTSYGKTARNTARPNLSRLTSRPSCWSKTQLGWLTGWLTKTHWLVMQTRPRRNFSHCRCRLWLDWSIPKHRSIYLDSHSMCSHCVWDNWCAFHISIRQWKEVRLAQFQRVVEVLKVQKSGHSSVFTAKQWHSRDLKF